MLWNAGKRSTSNLCFFLWRRTFKAASCHILVPVKLSVYQLPLLGTTFWLTSLVSDFKQFKCVQTPAPSSIPFQQLISVRHLVAQRDTTQARLRTKGEQRMLWCTSVNAWDLLNWLAGSIGFMHSSFVVWGVRFSCDLGDINHEELSKVHGKLYLYMLYLYMYIVCFIHYAIKWMLARYKIWEREAETES